MRNYLLLFLFFITSILNAQDLNVPENPKARGKYMYCFVDQEGKDGKWLKVLKYPTTKDVIKLQQRLTYLGYKVVETGVIDFQTKKQLQLFNLENKIGSHSMYAFETKKILKQQYKKKKKSS